MIHQRKTTHEMVIPTNLEWIEVRHITCQVKSSDCKLFTFTTNKHKYFKKRKQMKLYSAGSDTHLKEIQLILNETCNKIW